MWLLSKSVELVFCTMKPDKTVADIHKSPWWQDRVAFANLLC